ncbi:MAG: glycine oxidase ThiO, partial [Bacteroidota bacterium]
MSTNRHIAVVGGGVIGLSSAFRMARQGHRVTVIDRGELGRGTSWAAAGMLAPAAEIGFEELDLYRLGRRSLDLWPGFAKEVESASQHSVGYRTEGTLVVADDRDSMAALRRLHRFQQEQDVPTTWLTGERAREIEPLLSPRVGAAVDSPADHQVDNRALVDALTTSVRQLARVVEHATVETVTPGELPSVTMDDGSVLTADAVVVSAGVWSRRIDGLVPAPPVRPVKGEALSVRMRPSEGLELSRVIRGPDAYLVPKPDGRLVIGASSQERDDLVLTAGGVFRLLEGAVEVLPAVEEMELVETWVGQ